MKKTGKRLHARSAALTVFLFACSALGDVIEVGPTDDVEAAMNALAPGDELVLAGGTYSVSGRFGVSISGTEGAPIVIRAKDGERPHFYRDMADQNIIDVDMAEHVTFRGIELSGGSAGIRISGARSLTIEDCEIHDTGDVALRANDSGVLYESVRILRNHIHHTNGTGEGMYLGCNDNGCQFAGGLIEGNYIHHTNQASVLQGDGIELKEGSYDNVVRDNVIHDTNYPCILTYSAAGNGAPNVIERNLLFRCGDHAIQSAADAVIRNNIILGAGSNGVAMQPHQSGTPSNLVVVHNTVLDSNGAALSLSGATGSVVIANNALFTSGATALTLNGPLDQVTVSGNVIQGSVSGSSSGTTNGSLSNDFVLATFSGEPPNDVFPKMGGALVGSGDAAHVVADDFNGTARNGVADVGAYAFATDGNPGWPLAAGPKSSVGDPGDAGAAGGAGGMAGGGGTGTGAETGAGGATADGGASGGAPSGNGGTQSAGGAAGLPAGDPDSGAGGASAGDSGTTGGAASGDDSGCGCALARRETARAGLVLAALALALCLRRTSSRVTLT